MICGDENFILTEDELMSCIDRAHSRFFFNSTGTLTCQKCQICMKDLLS
jgi:hypothetical protein